MLSVGHNSTVQERDRTPQDRGFPYKFIYSATSSSFFFTFSLQIKIKICGLYTVLHIYFEHIQYYFAEFNMVQMKQVSHLDNFLVIFLINFVIIFYVSKFGFNSE